MLCEVLETVKLLKAGREKSDGAAKIVGDNQAYTTLQYINICGADLQAAIEKDDIANEFIAKEKEDNKKVSSTESVTPEEMAYDYMQNCELDYLTEATVTCTIPLQHSLSEEEKRKLKVKVDHRSGVFVLEYKVFVPPNLPSLEGDVGLHHMMWLGAEKKISRATYQLLKEQYEVDNNIQYKMKKKCKEMLNYRYLRSECIEYNARINLKGQQSVVNTQFDIGLGCHKSIDDETFNVLIEEIYRQHYEMIKNATYINLERYQLLEDLYKSDPVMSLNQNYTMMQGLGAQYLKWGRFTCKNTNNPFYCGMGVGEDGNGCDECNAKWQSMSTNGNTYEVIFGGMI